MKKRNYFLPFVLVPGAMLLCDWLDRAGVLNMNAYLMGGILLILSGGLGWLSAAPGRMAALMTLSLFLTMFGAGFLDETETYVRFTLRIGVKVSTQPAVLVLYAAMALTAWAASAMKRKIR